MSEKDISKRIEEIIKISKEKTLNPPVELILTTDGAYILKDLYDEYVKLLRQKEEAKKPYKEEDRIKYEQLMYIKDKMKFIEERGKLSEDTISLSAKDVEEYGECQKMYDELHSELEPVLKYFDKKEEKQKKETVEVKETNKEIEKAEKIVENTIQMHDINLNKIEVEEPQEKEQVKISDITNNLSNNKLLQDLEDIDKLLGLVGYNPIEEKVEKHESKIEDNNDIDIKVGDILTPLEDVNSYNNNDLKARKDEKYKVISFVSLDKNNKVANSSNLSDQTLNNFKKENKEYTSLFVISSQDESENKIVGSFDDITKFKKESVQ